MIAALRRGLYACGLALALAATSVLADVAAPYTEAEAAIRTGDPAKALRLLSSLNPTPPEGAERRHWALAVAHATLGNPEGAVPHLEALVAAKPANSLCRLELGRALATAGKSERARFHLTRARAADLAAEDETRALRSLAYIGARQKPLQGWLRFGLSLRVQHAGINAMGFAPVLEIGLERQRSTVPLYTWQNARVGITLTRAF